MRDTGLARRLQGAIEGEVLFGAFDRGRYATDASIYQVQPIGVVVPRTVADVAATLEIAREQGVPVLPRGGGTSQNGQTVGEALVVDVSRHLNAIAEFDVEARRVAVEPGIVLDKLNTFLRKNGLFFPVEPSTASRCTIGGMAGNNSCGARSLRYGKMVDNVLSIDAILPDGEAMRFGPVPGNPDAAAGSPGFLDLVRRVRAVAGREAAEVEARFPKVQRRVGGYNLDSVVPGDGLGGNNMAHLLVGSEGTLAFTTRVELEVQPVPTHRVLGVCHFPTFRSAMVATKHLVELGPVAVELVDRNIIELGRAIPQFNATLGRFVRGEPDSLLLVEFAGAERDSLVRELKRLDQAMADLGFPDAVVEVVDPVQQRSIWEVREAGLNIMMSMKGDGKPVSFIEDCAVPLEHLADYTDGLNEVFARHGTTGTWYAHASVGCLHVRPILNLKEADGARRMRAIAEEAFALVRAYKGSHSGEHGDGISRSEFHESMFGTRLVRAFEEIKDTFDPKGMMNPGKIVRAPRMDDRTLFRYGPDYAPQPLEPALDWSDWGGWSRAVEMCNNNGTCRKSNPGVMCPSFRATQDEKHVTRGRANSLRLALTGQLGPDALVSDEMYETMDLCVSCKGCKRECPTGVDMARMKIEFLHHYRKRHGLRPMDRLVAFLPRYAAKAARLGGVAGLRDRVPALARLSERMLGFSARRSLPAWRRDWFRADETGRNPGGPEVVLLADTFDTYFEPENLRAARAVLEAGGYRVRTARAGGESRPLCCGRTFLASGLVEEARTEARRTVAALAPFVARGVPVIGLEPSCLLTLRDEFKALLPGEDTDALAGQALLLEEFLAREDAAGRLKLPLKPLAAKRALVHGHCHQKAFGAMGAVEKALRLVPGLEVEVIDSGCCGMAGAFGFDAKHYDVSMKMAELSLLPAVRAADAETLIVADGTSCRHQIHDGARRSAIHVARVLEQALGQEARA
ncbi:FAD-binding and (Fe-S)-binding domain-containing protein [Skermanella sp. TT6]|uniref:FAD-binding and (Fe-S)-binding domain-containing protein n=1 Tax=Skermanella cutis TaxID=2775420 RepID=UPI001FFEE6BD|nr:FAD-binding and (Fe-S)-binding domain-containing protein [Skermanella sp. TT6]